MGPGVCNPRERGRRVEALSLGVRVVISGGEQANQGTLRQAGPGSPRQSFHLFSGEVAGYGNQKTKKKRGGGGVNPPVLHSGDDLGKTSSFLFLTGAQKLRQRTGC